MPSYFSPNQFGSGQVQAQQDSFLDHFEPELSVEPLTHFIEWFSGDQIDNIWQQEVSQGSAIFSMIGAIGEGFEIETGALNSDASLSFNDKRHYEPTGAVACGVARNVDATDSLFELGLNEVGAGPGGANDYSKVRCNINTTNFQGLSRNSGGVTVVDLGIPVNTNWTYCRTEITSANIQYSLDGVLSGTQTDNRPNQPMQPLFRGFTISGSTAGHRIRYYEAYNT